MQIARYVVALYWMHNYDKNYLLYQRQRFFKALSKMSLLSTFSSLGSCEISKNMSSGTRDRRLQCFGCKPGTQ